MDTGTAAGFTSLPRDQPPRPQCWAPRVGGGGCPPSQSDQRGQPAGSCRATFRGACASFLQSTSSSKQNTPGVQRLRGGRGVGALVASSRAQGASEAQGWQLGPGPQAEESPQGSITLHTGKFTRSADGK